MSAHLERGQLLLQQNRHAQAERELRLHLADQPDHAPAHTLLALCLLRREEWTEAGHEARRAVSLAPDSPFAHYGLAVVMHARNRFDEAGAAVAEAIRLDPDDADYRAVLAQVEAGRQRWADSLAAAEAGLALDPDHGDCANLRVLALRQLGRRDEADAAVAELLRRQPEDGTAHANQGWSRLHGGDPHGALVHFREALRLDPDDEWARQGMVEAIKARNPAYRAMLAYFLWMSRLGPKLQWVVIIGFIAGQQVLKAVRQSAPQLAPFIWPVSIALVAFLVLTWIAHPLSNLFLLLHRDGRLALKPVERLAAGLVGACLALALTGLAAWAATGDLLWGLGGLAALLYAMPTAAIFQCDEGWPRRMMAAYTLGLLALGLGGAVLAWSGSPRGGTLVLLFFLGTWLSTWAAALLTRATPTK